MAWLVHEDIRIKHGLHYQKYTVWGEISTLVVFFLLTLCSLEKYAKQINKENGQIVKLDNTWLYKSTAFLFQWAILCEATLTLLFWVYLWVIATDTAHMSNDQIWDKLRYDLFEDTENFNHSIPLALLLVELMINNIPFYWNHYCIVFMINVFYLMFQFCYCQITKEVVYPGIDWNNDAYKSLLKSLSTSIVTFSFFIGMRVFTNLKRNLNGIDSRIERANKLKHWRLYRENHFYKVSLIFK